MHLYISYAERSRVSKPSSCPPYRDREKGLSLNSTGLEVYRKGTDSVQRQHKTGVTMDMDGVYAWEKDTKETQTAQRHRRSTKENRASVRIAWSRRGQPRAQGLQTSAKAVSPLRFGHRAHKLGYGKVGKAMRQGMIHKIYCLRNGGYNAVQYPQFLCSLHAQKNYPLAQYIFFLLNKQSPERSENLIKKGKKINKQRP